MIDVSKRDQRDVALLTDSTCVKRCWLCHAHAAAWRGDPRFIAPKRESDKDYHRGIWGRNSNTRLLPPEFIHGWLASILSARTCEQPQTPTTHRFRNQPGRNFPLSDEGPRHMAFTGASSSVLLSLQASHCFAVCGETPMSAVSELTAPLRA